MNFGAVLQHETHETVLVVQPNGYLYIWLAVVVLHNSSTKSSALRKLTEEELELEQLLN